MKRDES
jgi:hypothetical protein